MKHIILTLTLSIDQFNSALFSNQLVLQNRRTRQTPFSSSSTWAYVNIGRVLLFSLFVCVCGFRHGTDIDLCKTKVEVIFMFPLLFPSFFSVGCAQNN